MDHAIDCLHEQLLQSLDLSHVGVSSISCAATMLRCALADGLFANAHIVGLAVPRISETPNFGWSDGKQAPDRYTQSVQKTESSRWLDLYKDI